VACHTAPEQQQPGLGPETPPEPRLHIVGREGRDGSLRPNGGHCSGVRKERSGMEQTGIRGAESWQFFAFVFAAVIALVFTLINEMRPRGWRIILKLVAFALIGYLTLVDPWMQSRLVDVLHIFKGPENP
jgi:hypothetical protein